MVSLTKLKGLIIQARQSSGLAFKYICKYEFEIFTLKYLGSECSADIDVVGRLCLKSAR